MATPFRLKRSAVADRRPTTTDLQLGELALNTHDGFLYAETTGVGSTVSLLTPWREQYGSPTSIYYNHRVGIGSTNPTVSLDVVGDTKLQNNLNVSGISTFGNNVIVENGSLEIKSVTPQLIFNDTTGTPDYKIRKQSGHFMIMETGQTSDSEWRLSIRNGGTIDIPGNLDTHGDLDVDGHTELDNLNVSGVSTFTNTININGVIEANSNLNVDGNLDVDGQTHLDDVSIVGVTTTTGNLNVTDGRILVAQSTAPQVRINSSTADGSATRFAFGLATGANQFINGSQSNDACISAPQELKFGIGNNLRFRITDSYIISQLDVLPAANDLRSLGNSSYRWSDLFAVDANISGNLDVDGHTELDNLRVSGVSTFTSQIFTGKVKISSDVNALSDPSVAGNYHLHITNPQNDGGQTVGIAFGLSTGGDIGAAITHERESSNSIGNLRFYTKQYTSPASMQERMRISKEGNVGINSTSPTSKLDVITDGGEGIKVFIPKSSSYTSGLHILNGSLSDLNADINFEIKNSESKISTGIGASLALGTNAGEALRIDPFNRVGIAYTFASYIPPVSSGGLYVQNGIVVDNFGINVGGISTFTGNIDANGHLDVDGQTDLDDLAVSGISTFSGSIIIKTSDLSKSLQIGKITGNTNTANYLGIQQASGSLIRGFATQYDNGSVFENLQGNMHQHLVLGDSTSGNNGTIFGISITESGTTYERLKLTGVGDLFVARDLDVTRNLDVDGTANLDDVDIDGNLDVDGHTELDNLKVVGVATFTGGGAKFENGIDTFDVRYITNTNTKITFDTDIISLHGNVGIGTTNPDSRLEIQDDAATGIIVRSTNTQSTHTNKALRVRNNSDTNTFAVSHRGQGYFASGIGIGTAVPGAPLHISGADANAARMLIEDNNNGFAASELRVQNGGRDLRIAAPVDIFFQRFNVGTPVLYLENGNAVGIRTDNPSATLDVFGSTKLRNDVDIDGNLDVDGRTELDITNISETLNVTGISTFRNTVSIEAPESTDAILELIADEGDDNGDKWRIRSQNGTSTFGGLHFETYASGSWSNGTPLKILSNGSVFVTGQLIIDKVNINDNIIQLNSGTDDLKIRGNGTGGTNHLTLDDDITVAGTATFEDRVTISGGKDLQLLDNGVIRLGNSSNTTDFQMFHNGTHMYINNGTGSLYITNETTSGSVRIAAKAGHNGATVHYEGSVDLYHNNVKRLQTTNTGVDITDNLKVAGISTFVGTVHLENDVYFNTANNADIQFDTSDNSLKIGYNQGLNDQVKLKFGSSGNFQIFKHSVSGAFIDNGGGDFYIRNKSGFPLHLMANATDEGVLIKNNAEVELYYDDEIRFETTAYGALLTGGTSGIGTIAGPATFHIDPVTVGDNTGTVVIKGNLQVDGTQTTVNSSIMNVADKNLELGSGAANDAAADGGGITIISGEGNKTFQFEATGDNLGSSEHINIATGKVYKVNNVETLSATTLGSAVVNSSLTNLGTLTSLDVNGHTELDNLNVSGISTFNDDVKLGDSSVLGLGSAGFNSGLPDLRLYHNGNSSNIINNTGHLYISQNASGKNLYLKAPVIQIQDSNSNDIITTATNGGITVKHNNSTKLQTQNYGVEITGTLDTDKLNVSGISTFVGDMNVANGSGIIEDAGGQLKIRANTFNFKEKNNTNQILFASGLGGVLLYNQGNKKLETQNYGVEITGTLDTDKLNVSGISTFSGDVNVGGALLHEGDTDTKIRFPANDTISMETAGSQRFRISDDKMRITGISSISINSNADGQRRVDIVTGDDNGVLIRPTTAGEGSEGSSDSIQDLIQLRNPWGSSAHNTGNAGARFGIQMRAYNIDGEFHTKDPAKSASIYAVSEDAFSGYWKNVGLAFYTSAYNQNQAEKVRINTNGNVGINSTSPTHKLEVVGASSLKGNLNVSGITTFSNGIFLPDNKKAEFGNAAGNANLEIFHDGSNHSYIRTASGSAGGMIIKSHNDLQIRTDNLQIKTNSLDDVLTSDVNGNVSIGNSLSIAGVSTFTGQVGFGTHITLEDYGEIQLGEKSGGDFKIYHDPTMFSGVYNVIESTNGNVFIVNKDTTNKYMYIRSNDLQLRDWSNNHAYIHCIMGGEVELYYANQRRFETTSTGAVIIDSAVSGSGISCNLDLYNNGNNSGDGSSLSFKRSPGNTRAQIIAVKNETSNNETDLVFKTTKNAGALVESLRIKGDTQTVGIGTDDPYYNLQVNFNNANTALSGGGGGNWGGAGLRLENNNSTAGAMSLVHFRVNNADWHIGNKYNSFDNSDFVFFAEGSEKVRIDSSGRVLIGTTTEGHPNADNLTIASSGDTGITIRSGTTNDGRIYFSDATSGAGEYAGSLHYDHNDNKFIIFTNGESRFVIDSSGRLLLGTDTEGHPNADDLTIATDGDTGITIRSGASHNGRIYFSDATSGTGEVVGSLDYDHNIDKFSIFTNNQPRFHIDSSGNVGINSGLTVSGITTSVGTFHITPSSGALSPKISYNDSIADAMIWADNVEARFGTSSDFRIYHDTTGDLNIIETHLDREIHIREVDGTNIAKFIPGGSVELYENGTKRLETTDTGVGISSNLTVSGVSTFTGTGHFNSGELRINGTNVASLHFNSSTNNPDYRVQNHSGELQLYDATNDKYRFIAKTNGRVGINTHNPARDFHVVGTSRFEQLDVVGFSTFGSAGTRFFHHTPRIEMAGSGTATISFCNATTGTTASDGMLMGFSSNSQVGFINVNESGHGFVLKTGSSAESAERIRVSGVGTFSIRNGTEEMVNARPNLGVELYFNGNKRLETTNTGVDITDNLNVVGIATITSTIGLSTKPSLYLNTTASTSFIHSMQALTPNMTSGQQNIIVVGKARSTKNTAFIGYKYSGTSGSNDNLFTINHWGANELVTVNGQGDTTIAGALDVDGHTELDQLNVSGITTSIGVINSQTDIRINNVSVIETALNDAVAMAIALG